MKKATTLWKTPRPWRTRPTRRRCSRSRPLRTGQKARRQLPNEPPIRTCTGCGRKAPQSELLRFAAVDGELKQGRTLPGRGVYTCARLLCFERAVARRGFNRVLKQTVAVDPEALGRLYTRTPIHGK